MWLHGYNYYKRGVPTTHALRSHTQHHTKYILLSLLYPYAYPTLHSTHGGTHGLNEELGMGCGNAPLIVIVD